MKQLTKKQARTLVLDYVKAHNYGHTPVMKEIAMTDAQFSIALRLGARGRLQVGTRADAGPVEQPAGAPVPARRVPGLARRFEPLVLLYIPAFVLEHYLIASARPLTGVEAYELFPFGTMFLLSVATNAPVSFLTGFLFTLGCRHQEKCGRCSVKISREALA